MNDLLFFKKRSIFLRNVHNLDQDPDENSRILSIDLKHTNTSNFENKIPVGGIILTPV